MSKFLIFWHIFLQVFQFSLTAYSSPKKINMAVKLNLISSNGTSSVVDWKNSVSWKWVDTKSEKKFRIFLKIEVPQHLKIKLEPHKSVRLKTGKNKTLIEVPYPFPILPVKMTIDGLNGEQGLAIQTDFKEVSLLADPSCNSHFYDIKVLKAEFSQGFIAFYCQENDSAIDIIGIANDTSPAELPTSPKIKKTFKFKLLKAKKNLDAQLNVFSNKIQFRQKAQDAKNNNESTVLGEENASPVSKTPPRQNNRVLLGAETLIFSSTSVDESKFQIGLSLLAEREQREKTPKIRLSLTAPLVEAPKFEFINNNGLATASLNFFWRELSGVGFGLDYAYIFTNSTTENALLHRVGPNLSYEFFGSIYRLETKIVKFLSNSSIDEDFLVSLEIKKLEGLNSWHPKIGFKFIEVSNKERFYTILLGVEKAL